MNNIGKTKRKSRRRRILSAAVSVAVAFTFVLPGTGNSVFAAEPGTDTTALYDLETVYSQNDGTSPEADYIGSIGTDTGDAVSREARLFKTTGEEDFRTYAGETDWYLGISALDTRKELETVKQSTDYGGNVVTTTYLNSPGGLGYPVDYQFAVVSLELVKLKAGGSSFEVNNMKLTINGIEYERILEDSFLTDHDYAAFPNSEVLAGSKSGAVVFAVTEKDAERLADWKTALASGRMRLESGDITAVAVEVNDDNLTKVPLGGYKVDSQFQTEKEILETYQAGAASGSYGIETPFFIRDPYGTAPLTGIAMFHTSRETEKIRVTVKGKTEDADISYTIESSGRNHEIPIIGFYPKYKNTFVLEALNGSSVTESGTVNGAATDTSGVSGYDTFSSVKCNDQYPLEAGLTLLLSSTRTVVDSKGDVRWFQKPAMDGCWGVNQITERGTFYFPDVSDGNKNKPSIIYEMNWSGKILAQYLYVNDIDAPDAHHDLAETPDGQHFIYEVNNNNGRMAFIEVDKNTGAVVKRVNASDIITPTKTLEVRGQWGTNDWAHMNTIDSVGDGTYIISYRNQHLAIRYDWENEEVLWAFSPATDYHKENTPQIADKFIDLQNVGGTDKNGQPIEWFYSQHDTTLLPDQDGDPDTDDLLIFDNGVDRSLTQTTNPKYSRIVHYRLNLKTGKAEQIFAWGKEDTSFYGYMYGGAQHMETTGNYIGTSHSKKFVEVTKEGKVALEIVNNNTMYRSYKIAYQDFVKGYVKLGTVKGKAFMRVGDETKFVKTEIPRDLGKPIAADINEIFLHDQQLMLSGTAYRVNAGASKSVFLVADNGRDHYYAPLLSNQTASAFNNTVKTAVALTVADLPKGRYSLGVLVDEGGVKAYEKTQYYLEKKGSIQNVKTDDEGQRVVVEELIAKAQDPANSLSNPIVVVNPFGRAPLSAVAAFHTSKPCTVEVTVKGKPASGEAVQADITYSVSGKTGDHVIPLIGLFADYENTVELKTSDGKQSVITVKTGAVNQTYVREAVVTATAQQRAETAKGVLGLTFLTPAGAQTVPMAIDVNGELRWAYMCAAAAPLETKPLADGHFLVPSDRPSTEIFVTDAETALEIDLLGRIYAEYFLDGMPHHEVYERKNGNLIFALSRRNHTAIEDYMAEVDRKTGETVRTWDLRKIFGIPDYDAACDEEKGAAYNPEAPHRANPSIVAAAGNHPYSDWFHQNSLDYDEGDPNDSTDDAIYVTGRHQSCVVKINAEKAAGDRPADDAIEWIYTDPSWLPQSTLDLESLILSPKGAPAALAQSTAEKEQKAMDELAAKPGMPEVNADQAEIDSDKAGLKTGGLGENAQMAGAEHGPQESTDSRSSANQDGKLNSEEATISMEHLAEQSADKRQERIDEAYGAETQIVPNESSSAVQQEAQDKTRDGGLQDNLNEAEELAVSAHSYIYGPHAVERLENGDLIVYDNFLYGSKTQMTQDASKLFSRAVRLSVNEAERTFEIKWEYGSELGSSHYTPFIGDVDYLGGPITAGEEVTDNHYLINFGGLTKNAAGEACDVVAAMLGGTISAEIMEYKDSGVIWSAKLTGSQGRVSSVYRAERVDLNEIPVSAEDYAGYDGVENRGMYTNTPKVDSTEVDVNIIRAAKPGVIPVTWKLLQDEGNRLIGKFTLPHILTDMASEGSKPKNVYVVLDMGADGSRVYKAAYAAAQPLLGITEGYYKFEIMKDNKVAQLCLLIERNDGAWILGRTGEVASADMQYVTGEIPVIDPVLPQVTTAQETKGSLLETIRRKEGDASILTIEKGGLEPGMKYVYQDPVTGKQFDLLYTPVFGDEGGYIALISGKSLSASEAAGCIRAVPGVVRSLRPGIVADDRSASINGLLRMKIIPDDFFYLVNQISTGLLPFGNTERILAMDVNGDGNLGGADITRLINTYVMQ